MFFFNEIFTFSKRTFEIMYYVSQNNRNLEFAFGGLQVVVFLQLSPVSDDGKYAFESKLWNAAFPHQIIVDQSFRSKNGQGLVTLFNEIFTEECSSKSLQSTKSFGFPLNTSDFNLTYIPQTYP